MAKEIKIFSEPVTMVYSWIVKPGKEELFKEKMHEIHKVARRFPGHMGVTTLQSQSSKNSFSTVLRFDSADNMHTWLNSPERRKLILPIYKIAQINKNAEATGLETWFNLPGITTSAPSKWKMVTTTFIGLYPLSLLFTLFIAPYILKWPSVFRAAVLPIVAPTLLTYWIMPFLTQKVLKPWLYKH
jgi:uncharacterized protein